MAIAAAKAEARRQPQRQQPHQPLDPVKVTESLFGKPELLPAWLRPPPGLAEPTASSVQEVQPATTAMVPTAMVLRQMAGKPSLPPELAGNRYLQHLR